MKTMTNESAEKELNSTSSAPSLYDKLGAEFSMRLDRTIEAAGLTNAEVAHRSGCAESTIRKWRKGKSTPDVPMLYALADAIGLSVGQLVGGSHNIVTERQSPYRLDEALETTQASTQPPCREEEGQEEAGTINVAAFFSIVEAAQSLEGDLSKEERMEIGMRMMRAIAVVSDHDDHEQRLDQEDFHALARIVRKLIGVSQT